MKIIETVELVFDKTGLAKFPNVQNIVDGNVQGFSFPLLVGKSLTGNDFITSDQYNTSKVSLQKNSLTFIKSVPVSFFKPTDLERFHKVEQIDRLDMTSCFVKYNGTDNVEGKALEIVFEYEQK